MKHYLISENQLVGLLGLIKVASGMLDATQQAGAGMLKLLKEVEDNPAPTNQEGTDAKEN